MKTKMILELKKKNVWILGMTFVSLLFNLSKMGSLIIKSINLEEGLILIETRNIVSIKFGLQLVVIILHTIMIVYSIRILNNYKKMIDLKSP